MRHIEPREVDAEAMTKQFEPRKHPVPAQWKFQTQQTWSPLMISNPARPDEKIVKDDKASDDPLRAIVDACISNVAVLDESGIILYASKAWRLFREGSVPEADRFDLAPYY